MCTMTLWLQVTSFVKKQKRKDTLASRTGGADISEATIGSSLGELKFTSSTFDDQRERTCSAPKNCSPRGKVIARLPYGLYTYRSPMTFTNYPLVLNCKTWLRVIVTDLVDYVRFLFFYRYARERELRRRRAGRRSGVSDLHEDRKGAISAINGLDLNRRPA